jgi:polynucleotide 5'-kinase involved in rRNA processing
MNPDRLILPLRTLGLHGRIPDFRAKEAWTNLLIGLCDSRTFTRSLGVINNIENNFLHCLTPLQESTGIKTIHFGSIKIPLPDCVPLA